jgi:hypothetical protein
VEGLAESCPPQDIEQALEEYLEIGAIIDGGLKQQVEFDLESLVRSRGSALSEREKGEFIQVQQQANRWTFIGSGMSHPNFLASVEQLSPAFRQRLAEVAPSFS